MQPFEHRVRSSGQTRRAVVGLCLAALLAAGWQTARAAATFDPNAQPNGWATRPAVSSNVLKSGNEVIYRSEYKAGLWTGTVRANYIDADGVVQGNSPWVGSDTATILAGTHWDTGRRIVTRTSTGANVPFRWGSLDGSQQTAFGNMPNGAQMLNFLRGDRSNESPSGLKYRMRTSVQGDIQQSTLLYWHHSNGQKRLYVGGNDGMLHVFNATSGIEVFAYLPSMLLARLPTLASTTYSHQLFVNGGLAMADVLINSTTRTWLAGALGGGGKGLFMLDMTDPSPANEAAAASTIKWEITPASPGFANLGFTYAAPRFARLNNGVAAVVAGNGYVNTGNGRATLLIINADTGALIREIDTGVGSTGSPNGLSRATLVDADDDGKVDWVYAGDIDGNLWRFDLRSIDPAAWSVVKLHTTSPQQAITAAPAVVNHPSGGRMVLFGTGRVLTPADESNTAVHHAYGLWDGAPTSNLTWLDQTITEIQSGTNRLRRVSGLTPNWASGGHRGWRLALNGGERIVGESPFAIDERFYFTTTNPTVAAAASGQASGSTWVMEVSFLTGGSPGKPIFDINEDNKIDIADNLGGDVIVGKHLGAGVSSQPLLVDLTKFSMTLFNQQSNLDYSLPTPSTDRGVSGGHFDVDFYFTSGTSFSKIQHVHEYDDLYDVTGVNMLNASSAIFNLGSKLGGTVAFKVLVSNQYLNPASTLSVGGGAFVSVKDYGGQTTAPTAAAALAGLPSYTLASTPAVNSLSWKLPLDAFKSKDWWGDGAGTRAGLIPTQTGCVNKVSSDGTTLRLGPNGERHNGALTIQIIKAATPDTALELNYPAGGAKYGWRVKQSVFTSFVLAEYTMFWHHPNGKCYGDSGWVANAPEDLSPPGSKTGTKAAGSQDPTDGAFVAAPPGVTVTGTTSTTTGNVTTIVVTFSDGKTDRTVITVNSDGTESLTLTDRNGNVTTKTRMSTGSLGNAPQEILQPSRRINWREVVRP